MDNKKKKFSFIDLADDFSLEEKETSIEKNESIPIINNTPLVDSNVTKQQQKPDNNFIKQDDLAHENNNKTVSTKSNSNKKYEKKINALFQKKEKLEVKTNIYLKKWIYDEIEKIYKETGKSRSAIINKLLEIYLTEMDKENE